MKILNIAIKGNTDNDLRLALEEILRKITEGYTSGFDSNDRGIIFYCYFTIA